jgi:hypothetical protein
MKEGKTKHGTGRAKRRGTKEWNVERDDGEGGVTTLPNRTTRTQVGCCLRIAGPNGRYFWRANRWLRMGGMRFTASAHRDAE